MIPQRLINQIKHTFEHASEAVYIKDQNFKYHYVNQTVLDHLSLKKEEILLFPDSQLPFSQYAHIYNAHDNLAMAGSIFYQIDLIENKEQTFFCLSKKFPLKDEYGMVHGSYGLCEFLTLREVLSFLNTKPHTKLSMNLSEHLRQQLGLSKREMEVLYYFLQGFSAKSIAPILSISTKTIIFHLNNIKTKWQCNSKEAIYHHAIKNQLLSILSIRNLI